MAAKKTKASKPAPAKSGRPTIKSSHERGFPARKPKSSASGASEKSPRSSHERAKATRPDGREKTRAKSASPTPKAAPNRGGPSGFGKPLPATARPKRKPGTPAGASVATDAARRTAILVAVAALEKKAVGLEILDVAGRVDYADFLVLMTGRSDRQVAALSQSIEEELRKEGVRATSIEGLPHASWVLMDFGDVVVHVFQEGARKMYDLDSLWSDVMRVPVPGDHDLN